MKLNNTDSEYGLIAKLLHWSIAIVTIALFGLGLWMTGLGYYDTWYVKAPRIHEGAGVLLLFALLLRLLWRRLSTPPVALKNHTSLEKTGARLAHLFLNGLLLLIAFSGYFIVTAKGEPLVVFDLFHLPAIVDGIDNLEDISGKIHYYLAWAITVLASVHALAAIKHHFIDKDMTLRRML